MKRNLIYSAKACIILICSVMLVACQKNPAVESPGFDVQLDSTTYKVSSPVVFKFTGDADVILFYSGAPGNQYDYRERTTVTGKPQLQFTSYRQYGPQSNTIHLLVSKDFNNNFFVPDVQKATWTDITSDVIFSSGADNTASGVIDLSAYATETEPINIAFRYTAINTTVSQPTWTIKNLVVGNKQADGSLVSIATSANMSWGIVNFMGTQTWSASTTQIAISGGPIATPDNEDWCITQQLILNRVAPDLGVSVKSNPTTLQKTYTFAGYTTPGTYKVTFVARNANKWSNKSVVKEFTITVK